MYLGGKRWRMQLPEWSPKFPPLESAMPDPRDFTFFHTIVVVIG